MIVCAKVSVFPEYALMYQELKSASLHWDNHFNSNNYEGSWKVLPLRSVGGQDTIIPGLTANDVFADHPNMDLFPSVRKLLVTFQCTVKSVRLLNLAAGNRSIIALSSFLAFSSRHKYGVVKLSSRNVSSKTDSCV